MIRRLLLALGFWVTGVLFADGSSGDYLLSPENEATTTKQFGGGSDSYDRGGWYFESDKGYARKAGVGLRKENATTLRYDFPEGASEQIQTLTVTCRQAAAGSNGKENTLFYELLGTEMSGTRSFVVTSPTDEVTLSFTFESAQSVTGFRFSNSGANVFEIASVAWTSTLPKIEINCVVSEEVELGATINVSVNEVTGGSGIYSYLSITFNGSTLEYMNPDFPKSPTFTVPQISGACPVKVLVRDSTGIEQCFETSVMVLPYATPYNLTASEITRNSFELTWDLNAGATPAEYQFILDAVRAEDCAQIVIAPTWVQTAENEWQSDGSFDITPWTDGWAVNGVYGVAHGYSGALSISLNEGSWQTKPCILGRYLLGKLAAGEQKLRFKTTATPPRYITLDLQKINWCVKSLTFKASAQERRLVVSDLPTGMTFTAKLMASYSQVDGTAIVTRISDPLTVSTLAFPGFTATEVYPKISFLQLTWPDEKEIVKGELKLFAERSVPHDIPASLYLSRILWTKSGDGLTTSKAIVLTNLSSRPIHLRGNYTLQAVRRDTGTIRKWDFSVEDEQGTKTYPYIIPVGGELVIAHASYPLSDVREGVVHTTTTALNFTDAWDLSLYKVDTLQNTLTPQLNSIVRLKDESLEETETTAITVDLPNLDALYNPWMKIIEVRLIDTQTVTRSSSTTMFMFSSYLKDLSVTRKVWASCRTFDGEIYSPPLDVMLWEPATNPGMGFYLR